MLPRGLLRSVDLLPRLLRRLLLMARPRVLFVCVENSCRSLMAEAMFNSAPPAGWVAVSAGTRPATAPNPRTRPMLAEIGLELPRHRPQGLTDRLINSARLRVSMGCLDDASCPARLKSIDVRDWALADPAKLDDRGFRRVRDELARRVNRLVSEIRDSTLTGAPARVG